MRQLFIVEKILSSDWAFGTLLDPTFNQSSTKTCQYQTYEASIKNVG